MSITFQVINYLINVQLELVTARQISFTDPSEDKMSRTLLPGTATQLSP